MLLTANEEKIAIIIIFLLKIMHNLEKKITNIKYGILYISYF